MQTISVTIASYNMSFACGQGKKIGSEKKFIHDSLHREKLRNPQKLFENSLTHLEFFWEKEKPDFIGLQEINDEDFVNHALGTKTILNQFLINETDMYDSHSGILKKKEGEGYYIYGIKNKDQKKPTIMMLWNTEKLGKGKHYYGGELGDPQFEEDSNKQGRLIQMVITDTKFVLINLHGPNSKKESHQGMKYLTQKINEFIKKYISTMANFSKVFIVGDFNDPYGHYGSEGLELDLFPTIKFRSRRSDVQEKIKSCCYNFDSADFEENKYEGNEFLTGRPGKYDEKSYSLEKVTFEDEQSEKKKILDTFCSSITPKTEPTIPIQDLLYEDITPKGLPTEQEDECKPYEHLVEPVNAKPEINSGYDATNEECEQFSFGKRKRGMISTYLFEGDYCLGFCVQKNLAIWGRKTFDVFSKESDHELVWGKFWSFV